MRINEKIKEVQAYIVSRNDRFSMIDSRGFAVRIFLLVVPLNINEYSEHIGCAE